MKDPTPLRAAPVLIAALLLCLSLAACTTTPSPPSSAPSPSPSPEVTPVVMNPNLIRDGRIACFSAAMQRSTRVELTEETGASSGSLAAIARAIATNTGIEEEDAASFVSGCTSGLRRSGVQSGQVFPMSSTRVLASFVEMCAATAHAVGDIEVAAEAMGTEADSEELARSFVGLLARERGVNPPEAAVQACAQGFLRVFSGI